MWVDSNPTKKCNLPETNSLPLKMDGWNTTFLLGRPIFRGYVSFREGNVHFFICARVDQLLIIMIRDAHQTSLMTGMSGILTIWVYIGCGPLPVTVTTRIFTFLVGNPNLNLHLPQERTPMGNPYINPI